MSMEIVEPQDEPESAVRALEDLFKKERTRFYDFTREVDQLLAKLVSSESIEIVNIEARTKSVDSFLEKAYREEGKYSDPMSQITDISACRVICYYVEDIDRLDGVIRENFDVDEKNSSKKDKSANPKEFGYLSRHLVVSLNSDRAKLGEYRRFKEMKCEIQIRTVLQHAWAAIEHKLQYKTRQDVPQPLQRKLFQISAVLEMADDQFSYIRQNLTELRRAYREDIEQGHGIVPINVDSVDVFISESSLLSALKTGLTDVGFSLAPSPPTARNPLSKLNDTIRSAKIESVGKLDELLKTRSTEGWLAELHKIWEQWKQSFPERRTIYGVTNGPSRLVLDDATLVRVLIIIGSQDSPAHRVLKEVPFGGKLQSALTSYLTDRGSL